MNAIELLEHDHRTVETLFGDFDSDTGDGRQEILSNIIRELSIHSALEEAYVYPRIRSETPGGERYYEECVREHQAMKESLARIEGRLDKAHTKEVADLVETLKKKTLQHVEEEETEVLPAFAQVATKQELTDLGRKMKEAKDTAPTRPHPNQPAANALTAWANGLIDRARDTVAGRAQ